MQSEDRYHDVWKRIEGIKFAMLTTIGSDGSLTARPMTTVQKDFSGTLWFFASRSSPPVVDATSNPSVGVQYSEPKDDRYVSLSGEASIVDDRAQKERLWTPAVKVYFPGGVDDPDLTLLRVDIHTAEYWDVTESKPVQLFKMARAAIKGERPTDLGEHRTVAM